MAGEKTTRAVRAERLVARAEEAGERLDVFLAARVPELSRRHARLLIEAGAVSIDGKRSLVLSRRVAAGQEILCHVQDLPSSRPEALEAGRVLYEDRSLIAIDKPAGVSSHPTLARRLGSALQLTEELLRRRAGEKVPLWPLHRLDAGTSGVLLFAKSRRAARAASQSFARRRVSKRYVALVAGVPDPPAGEIRLRLQEGSLATRAAQEGKEATTRYRVLEALPAAALLDLEPLTGRMHQIRVHLSSIGHPVLGDSKYGKTPAASLPPEAGRLFLHASRIELPHPERGRPFTIESPLPPDFEAALRALRRGSSLRGAEDR